MRIGDPRDLFVAELVGTSKLAGDVTPGGTWLGRAGALAVEIVGDPVEQLSLKAEPSRLFGAAINTVTHVLSVEDYDGARLFFKETLGGWGDRLVAGVAEHLDATFEGTSVKIRVQDLLGEVVVTWSA